MSDKITLELNEKQMVDILNTRYADGKDSFVFDVAICFPETFDCMHCRKLITIKPDGIFLVSKPISPFVSDKIQSKCRWCVSCAKKLVALAIKENKVEKQRLIKESQSLRNITSMWRKITEIASSYTDG